MSPRKEILGQESTGRKPSPDCIPSSYDHQTQGLCSHHGRSSGPCVGWHEAGYTDQYRHGRGWVSREGMGSGWTETAGRTADWCLTGTVQRGAQAAR